MTEWQEHVGVGERSNAFVTTGSTRRRPVITDQGPNRGEVGGYQTDHKDGRVDAHVFAPCTSTRTKVQED